METNLAIRNHGAIITKEQASITREQVELIKRIVCKDATDDELSLFVSQCKRMKLDPFSGQIWAIKRYDKSLGKKVLRIQIGVDGYRLIAERTGKYVGQTAPLWCGKDKQWTDIWIEDEPPAACKIGVYKKGCTEPFWGIARYKSSVQTNAEGTPTNFWSKDAPGQLAKCAEVFAIRKAFPMEIMKLEELTIESNGKPVLPDIRDEYWDEMIVPDFFLPEALKGKEITFKDLACDGIKWNNGKGKEYKGRQLIHMWTSDNACDEINTIAQALITKYPSHPPALVPVQPPAPIPVQPAPVPVQPPAPVPVQPPAPIPVQPPAPIPVRENGVPPWVTVSVIKENKDEVFENNKQGERPQNLPDFTNPNWIHAKVGFKKAGELTWQNLLDDHELPDGKSGLAYLKHLSNWKEKPYIAEVAIAALAKRNAIPESEVPF